jgi:hypothetical protein
MKIRAFRAIDEFDTCLKYKEHHVNVLRDYGITNVTSSNDEWIQNPNMYCVIAETSNKNEMIGGIRVQVSDSNHLLPVETAIGKMDNRIFQLVHNYRVDGGVGELCGLWNAKKISGYGVSVLLVRAGISITNQLKFKTMIGICAEYSLKMFQNVGFIIDKSLGVHGDFPYPNDTYKANVVGILNAETLNSATNYDKERMDSLRSNPKQTFIEKGPKGEIVINYNLVINNND